MKESKRNYLYLLLIPIISLMFGFTFVSDVLAEQINEIRLSSTTTEVWPGVLPTFQISTTTDHATVEAYGSNTHWVKWATGYDSWHAFGTETPTAVKDDSTHYGLDASVHLDDGYEFGDNVAIYFNNTEVTNDGHTSLRKFDWGGYVTIDLGIAVNEAGTYRVTYDTKGGTSVQGETVTSGETASVPTKPTKSEYVFGGWYSDSTLNTQFDFNTPITDNVVLFAKWNTKIAVAAATISNPVAGQMIPTNLTPVDDTKYTVALAYWYEAADPFPTISGTQTFEAGKSYAVRFNFYANEGYAFDSDTQFTLNGSNTSCVGELTNREFTYYDLQAPQTLYTVTLDPQNGTSESSEITNLELNQSIQLGTPESYNFTIPNGKTFDGWMVSGIRVGAGESFNVTGNMVALAQWLDNSPQNHTVTFNSNGGTPLAPVNIAHGSTVNEPTPPPTNGDQTFGGWFSDSTLNTPFDFSTPINTDIELFAYWIPNSSPQQPQGEDITFNITYNNSFANTKINNINVMEESQDFSAQTFTYNNVVVPNAGTTDPNQTNEIKLQVRFGDHPFDSYTINGVEYDANNANVQISQEDEWTITVPGAATYTITGTANTSAAVPRTIIWANVDADTNAANYEEDMRLEHGTAKVIGIFDSNDQQVAGETDVDPNTGMGYVVVNPGDKVLFEFIPEYGYQLTSVKANGFDLEPQDEINQYIFEMPNTNIHFQAEFKQTKDVVKAQSEKVKSGTISLADELDGGSAQLTVKDVTLSADKITGFENAAGEYEIANYLDIDLYNVYYKGKDDANDVWEDKIDELNHEATITIKLAKGINAEDIVLVHNIHDGEQYEIIPILSYNKNTNTITFKTKSFSNYAIAAKNMVDDEVTSGTTSNKTSNPRTFDSIYTWIGILLISTFVLLIKISFRRKPISK